MALDKPKNKLDREKILEALASADQLALRNLGQLRESLQGWSSRVNDLCEEKCPVSYLPMLCVLLVARSMFPASELNVLHIKQSTSGLGYSASSIGLKMMPFMKSQNVYLRTNTSQPLMSQPFTHKEVIGPDMAGAHKKIWYQKFYACASDVQDLNHIEAREVLAHIIHKQRGKGFSSESNSNVSANLAVIEDLIRDVSVFVHENSQSGKVGQAFAAALYEVVYPSESIRMGKNHDPSFTVPGDVQVGRDGSYWILSEVRQRPIVTGDVTGFLDAVHEYGCERATYWALKNQMYEGQINEKLVQKNASKKGISVVIYCSPDEALEELLFKAPGTFTHIATHFLNKMTDRLNEAETDRSVRDAWHNVVKKLSQET